VLEDLPALLGVCQFAPAETQRELHAVASGQKAEGVVDLDLQVMVADLGSPDADLLELGLMPVGLGLLLLLALRVHPLAVIHDPANGWLRLRGDLDEVHPGVAGALKGIPNVHDSKLLVGLADQANRRDSDLSVATKILADGVCSLQ
jgi:hypothetical protein